MAKSIVIDSSNYYAFCVKALLKAVTHAMISMHATGVLASLTLCGSLPMLSVLPLQVSYTAKKFFIEQKGKRIKGSLESFGVHIFFLRGLNEA